MQSPKYTQQNPYAGRAIEHHKIYTETLYLVSFRSGAITRHGSGGRTWPIRQAARKNAYESRMDHILLESTMRRWRLRSVTPDDFQAQILRHRVT
jgi:hypothetical protein